MISSQDVVPLVAGLGINLILAGSLLTAGVLAAHALVRDGAPRLRYLLVVIGFSLTITMSVVARVGESRAPEGPLDSGLAAGSKQFPQTVSPSYSDGLHGALRKIAEHPFGAVFVIVWICGAALLLAREAIGHAQLAMARRGWHKADTALRRKLDWPDDVALYLHENTGPLTVGLIHPAEVLPARLLDDSEIDALKCVARHELAHARWHDPAVNSALRAACAALWPAFPLWLLARIACAEREAAADRAAISDCERRSGSAADYADALVRIARWSAHAGDRGRFNGLAAHAGNASDLEKRIRRLLTLSAPPSYPRITVAVAAFLLCLATSHSMPLVTQPRAREGRDKAPLGDANWHARQAAAESPARMSKRQADH